MSDSSVPLPRPRRSSRRPRARVVDQGRFTRPELLTDRLLVHVDTSRVGFVRDHLDPLRGGLVISGPKALGKAFELRGEGFEHVLLADPAFYEDGIATAEAPYLQRTGELPASDPLGQAVQEQFAAGATAALGRV
ncbi:hypothetical protein [Kitasatospora purpeofusca]|uniref:hypothetical protein n=1 Tax=Kitasatospora purpeofusca TaxID=67352 RepID=UPI0036D328CF